MTSEPPPLQPGRKRRAHKRSRNGCSTCKQRHIRCDEVKPICTNCLTRGGECGYPEPGGALTPGSASGSASGAAFKGTGLGADLLIQRLVAVPSSPADPFDCLPIKMPHRSLELFHHYAHYRIFSQTAVPKNPDSDCVAIALSSPGTFRACLLMTALNYSWLSGPGSLQSTDMEETFLYHKLEAMRLVNEQIGDPAQSTSDGCLSLIAALALVESGMGDHVAAEAHLNGLFNLLDMRRPEEWQHRIYGLLQRIILVTGTYIAAAKSLEIGGLSQLADMDLGLHDQRPPHYTRLPSSLFSTAPMVATRLSPFYLSGTPCVEACKADVEGLVLINSLRRLAALPVIDPPLATTTAASSRSSSLQPTRTGSPERGSRHTSPPKPIPHSTDTYRLPPEAAHQLLTDTDSYIASLLFKPQPLLRSTLRARTPRDQSRSLSPALFGATPRTPTPGTTLDVEHESEQQSPEPAAAHIRQVQVRTDPFENLPAELFPSASRAWATAGYLFLHVVLAGLWDGGLNHPPPDAFAGAWSGASPSPGLGTSSSRKRKRNPPPSGGDAQVDPYLLRTLLDTLCVDIEQTEEAMRQGAYSSELWLWKVVAGAYTVEVTGVLAHGGEGGFAPLEGMGGEGKGKERKREPTHGRRQGQGRGEGQGPGQKSFSFFGSVLDENRNEDDNDDDQGDKYEEPDGNPELDAPGGDDNNATTGSGAWFGERIRAWSAASGVTDWVAARRMLGRIVWPEEPGLAEMEAIAEGLWWRAVGDGGGGDQRREREGERGLPVMVAVDPRLM